VRQRAGATVENALHVVQNRKDDLIFFADLMQIEPAGKIAK
jgi:hypothetical protein